MGEDPNTGSAHDGLWYLQMLDVCGLRPDAKPLQMLDVCGLRPDAKEKVEGGNVSVVREKKKNKHNQHDVQRQQQQKHQHNNQKTAVCMTKRKRLTNT